MYSFSDKNQKIALIGCGYWGTIIVKSLLSLGFKKIFIYDLSRKNTLTLKKKYKILKVCKNYNEILLNKEIMNLFYATPPSKNYLLVKKGILNNKNIFLEKPGFNKLSDIYKISKLLKKNKNTLMFGYVYCFNDYIKYIKNIIYEKKLGNLLYINFQRQNLGPIRNDVEVSEDLSSHDLSIILNIFGKLPKILSHNKYSILKKNIADISNLHLKLGDTFIDISNTWINPTKIRRITIIGSKKMLLFDEMNLLQPIKIYNKYAQYPKIEEFKKKFFTSKALIYEGNNFSPKIKTKSSLNNEIKHFFYCSHRNKKPIPDINFSTQILRFLKKI